MSDSRQPLVIYGAWYFGNVIKEAAEATGWQVLGHVDPDPPDGVTTVEAIPPGASVFVAIGDNKIRAEVTETLLQHGRSLPCIAHPSATFMIPSFLEKGKENTHTHTHTEEGINKVTRSPIILHGQAKHIPQ